jgi:hypothetical protein
MSRKESILPRQRMLLAVVLFRQPWMNNQTSYKLRREVSQLAASLREEKTSRDRPETRHQGVRTDCSRLVESAIKQCHKQSGVFCKPNEYRDTVQYSVNRPIIIIYKRFNKFMHNLLILKDNIL